jgi:hypothetical protein
MNLNELYHKYETSSLSAFLSKVVPHQQLATGSYGAVIITPSNYVYKLWTEDDAYDEFVELCQKNQHLPFIPKFYKRKDIKNVFLRNESSPDTIKVLKMEKLKSIPENIVANWPAFNKACNEYEYDDGMFNVLIDDKKFLIFVKEVIFGWLKNQSETEIDFSHYGNIMLREDGQYVLTDPFVSNTRMITIHASLDKTEKLIYGRKGEDLLSLPLTLDIATTAYWQDNMTKESFSELRKLIDISLFCKKVRSVRENFIKCLLSYGTQQEIEKSILIIPNYVLTSSFFDSEIFDLFLQRCEQYSKVAEFAYDYNIEANSDENDNKLYKIIYDHLANKRFDTTLALIKNNRPFYKWLIMNDINPNNLVKK